MAVPRVAEALSYILMAIEYFFGTFDIKDSNLSLRRNLVLLPSDSYSDICNFSLISNETLDQIFVDMELSFPLV